MKRNPESKGSFTLPGEAGFEDLTLALAEKWGADVIRDSDGTQLSDKIINSDYDIYSTLCLVRADNAWARANMDKLQQNYLMSFPVTAKGDSVCIDLLKGYFREQFILNKKDDPKEWWQVFDRTAGREVPADKWSFDAEKGTVTVRDTVKWHKYTVNFLAVRIWEEISMYNHITNNWGDKEHLMSVEPMYPETQAHLLELLEKWLREHPDTDVVRFTSMFYNFCWFWGDDPNLRFIYSDWASYDFTVNPYSLRAFEKSKGYRMTSEDFVNGGLFNSTHNVPTDKYRDWMDLIINFVVEFGKKCVDLVHQYGKKAYVFYDDHWIGVEPQGDRFGELGFDGLIKCVFNAFEARLCAASKGVPTHELRLHPYLFPTGLTGEPTFKEGGNPKLDAQKFWVCVRRALLRQPVDRIGLGGYLHLVEQFPDFMDYIEEVADEFRMLKSFHAKGAPYTAPCKVAVLTAWGRQRTWSCSGHMHEHPELELIRVLEALAGLPVEVEFISFDDVLKQGVPVDVKVLINAGRLDSAWCGGRHWNNAEIIEKITEWVACGGGLIGIGEPSSAKGGVGYFKMAHVLGVDREIGLSICKSKYSFQADREHFITAELKEKPDFDKDVDNVFVVDGDTRVLFEKEGSTAVAVRDFEKGRGVYFSGYKFTPENVRLLHRAIFWASGMEADFETWTGSNVHTDCAYYPGERKLVVINNTGVPQETVVSAEGGKKYPFSLEPFGIKMLDL